MIWQVEISAPMLAGEQAWIRMRLGSEMARVMGINKKYYYKHYFEIVEQLAWPKEP
jgi:hypothetical protein